MTLSNTVTKRKFEFFSFLNCKKLNILFQFTIFSETFYYAPRMSLRLTGAFFDSQCRAHETVSR